MPVTTAAGDVFGDVKQGGARANQVPDRRWTNLRPFDDFPHCLSLSHQPRVCSFALFFFLAVIMASGFGLNGGTWFLFSPGSFGWVEMARVWCRAFPPTNILELTPRSLGPSRCYGFWQEVLGCYVVNSGEGETGKKKCMPALEDYYECLHHKKEVRSRLTE